MRGTIGLILQVAFLGVAWLAYQTGFGVGPGGVVPMLWGVAIATIGLLVGAILGAVSLMKEERNPAFAAIAILIPLGVLALLIIRRIGPL